LSTSILIYGRDRKLLETRRWVLETAGFQVSTTAKPTEVYQAMVAQHIDLFILCHTLSAEDQGTALATAHALRPGMKNLVLVEDTFESHLDPRDTILSAFATPTVLIGAVQKIVGVPALSQTLA